MFTLFLKDDHQGSGKDMTRQNQSVRERERERERVNHCNCMWLGICVQLFYNCTYVWINECVSVSVYWLTLFVIIFFFLFLFLSAPFLWFSLVNTIHSNWLVRVKEERRNRQACIWVWDLSTYAFICMNMLASALALVYR